MTMERLAEIVRPLTKELKDIDPSDPNTAVAALGQAVPFDGPLVASVREAALAGAAEGWLLPKEAGGIRFGRVARDLDGLSVDAVLMSRPGPRHRHPSGEIDLCFATSGDPRFDGHPEGWVVYPPDSTHVPTVSGGEMLILYFLPGGAIEFST